MFENVGRFLNKLKSKSPTFRATRSEEILLRRTDFGKVTAEIYSIERVVVRAAQLLQNIEQASVTAEFQDKLKLRFSLELTEGKTVQEMSKELVEAVRGELTRQFGIEDVEIYVRVENVKQVEKPKRRVR